MCRRPPGEAGGKQSSSIPAEKQRREGESAGRRRLRSAPGQRSFPKTGRATTWVPFRVCPREAGGEEPGMGEEVPGPSLASN